MKILAALRADAANYYRIQAPFLVLKHMGYDVTVKIVSIEDAENYDVLWLQMHADPAADIVMREFKDRGKTVVYDVDDWLFEMPPTWDGYDQYFSRGSTTKGNRMILFERALSIADIVTCTTDYLAGKLAEIGRPAKVLPNCVMMGDWDILGDTKHDQDGPVVGWFGTGNHWDDWVEIAPAVDEAIAEVGGYLALMGAPEVLACFPKRLRERTLISPIVEMRKFQSIRALIKACDVGIAWVTDRLEAAKCRSPLKAFQWGAAGVPFVASGTVYKEVAGGFSLAANPIHLTDKIVDLVEDEEHLNGIRANLWRETVWRKHSYEMQALRWIEVLENTEREGV